VTYGPKRRWHRSSLDELVEIDRRRETLITAVGEILRNELRLETRPGFLVELKSRRIDVILPRDLDDVTRARTTDRLRTFGFDEIVWR
jgi:hypothetical protein